MTDYFILKVYLVFLILALLLGIYLSLPHHSKPYYMGLNNTKLNNSVCRYTWLGGADYDSFVRDISVDNVSKGHPPAGSVIHHGNCSAVVRIFLKDVKTYVQFYPKAGGI